MFDLLLLPMSLTKKTPFLGHGLNGTGWYALITPANRG